MPAGCTHLAVRVWGAVAMENLVRWVLGADLSPNTGSDLSGTWPGQATGTEWSGQEILLLAQKREVSHWWPQSPRPDTTWDT